MNIDLFAGTLVIFFAILFAIIMVMLANADAKRYVLKFREEVWATNHFVVSFILGLIVGYGLALVVFK